MAAAAGRVAADRAQLNVQGFLNNLVAGFWGRGLLVHLPTVEGAGRFVVSSLLYNSPQSGQAIFTARVPAVDQ